MTKSKGHLAYIGTYEYYLRSNGEIHAAPIANPVMTDGCRAGRFECFPHLWDGFKAMLEKTFGPAL